MGSNASLHYLVREHPNALDEVAVALRVRREHLAQQGNHAEAVRIVEWSDGGMHTTELETGECAARSQDAVRFRDDLRWPD